MEALGSGNFWSLIVVMKIGAAWAVDHRHALSVSMTPVETIQDVSGSVPWDVLCERRWKGGETGGGQLLVRIADGGSSPRTHGLMCKRGTGCVDGA